MKKDSLVHYGDVPIDFEYLHSLWDGKASNVSEICGSCGACCSMTKKPLVPGEYEYFSAKGVENGHWVTRGCLCAMSGLKPVICKTYPIQIHVDKTGYYVAGLPEEYYYSTRCQFLEWESTFPQLEKFLDYFFSFYENRVYWCWNYAAPTFAEEAVSPIFKEHGFSKKDIGDPEYRAFSFLMGLEMDEHNVILDTAGQYVWCKDRPTKGFENLIKPVEDVTEA